MKKAKLFVSLALLVQAVSFIVLFFVFWGKKKSLAKAFAAIGVAGGAVGTVLLLSHCKDEERKKHMFDMDDEDWCDDDFDDESYDDDDIACSADCCDCEECADGEDK